MRAINPSQWIDGDTICAEATPSGRGAISIIRVSGPKAFEVASRVCEGVHVESLRRKRFVVRKSLLRDLQTEKPIDEGLILFFQGPHSYTGEDCVEFQVHGNPVVVTELIESLISGGVRGAGPGEFTRRALLNGKCTLDQAESIGTLIEASDVDSKDAALGGLRNLFLNEMTALRDAVTVLYSTFMAALDFPEEGIDGVASSRILSDSESCRKQLHNIVQRASLRSSLVAEHRVVLLGLPNAGKSSLFNALLNTERAIVTPIRGTTRDFITETRIVHGISMTFVDTAGIEKDSLNPIELLGMDGAINQLSSAELIIYCVDAEKGLTSEDLSLLNSIEHQDRVVPVWTKVDLKSPGVVENPIFCRATAVSARNPSTVDGLLENLANRVKTAPNRSHSAFVVSRYQLSLLKEGVVLFDEFHEKLAQKFPEELLVEDLKTISARLDACLGPVVEDEILEKVFETFCVGK